MRITKSRFYRTKLYFFRGHNSWLYVVLWGVSIVSIYYGLLIPNLQAVPVLDQIFGPLFSDIFVFAFVFALCYIPVAIMIGRWDYLRGAYSTETVLLMRQNPVFQALISDVTNNHELIDANHLLLLDLIKQNMELRTVLIDLKTRINEQEAEDNEDQ